MSFSQVERDRIRRIQRAVGVEDDGYLGPITERAVLEALSEVPTEPTIQTPIHLHDRVLKFALQEATVWQGLKVSVAQVKRYLLGCVRDGTPGHGQWLHDTYDPTQPERKWAFCAAFRGYCEDRAAGELKSALPPWRSGVFEVMRDAQNGRRPGERWAAVSEFYSNGRLIAVPPPGSGVIYQNRLSPAQGHLETLIQANEEGICSVGGNESGGKIVVDLEPIPWSKLERADGDQRLFLLGFVVRT